MLGWGDFCLGRSRPDRLISWARHPLWSTTHSFFESQCHISDMSDSFWQTFFLKSNSQRSNQNKKHFEGLQPGPKKRSGVQAKLDCKSWCSWLSLDDLRPTSPPKLFPFTPQLETIAPHFFFRSNLIFWIVMVGGVYKPHKLENLGSLEWWRGGTSNGGAGTLNGSAQCTVIRGTMFAIIRGPWGQTSRPKFSSLLGL